ncbi:MAG: PAS domain S-box protein [Myxococcota bacterium]
MAMLGRFKLLAVVAAVALFAGGAALLAVNLHRTFRQAMVDNAHRQLKLLAVTASRRIESFVLEHDKSLRVAAAFPISRSHQDGTCAIETLFEVQAEHLLAVALVDDNGQILHSHPESLTDADRGGLLETTVKPRARHEHSYGLWFSPERAHFAIIHPLRGADGVLLAFVLDATSLFERYVNVISNDLATCGWLMNESTTLLGSHEDGAVGHKIMDFKTAEFPGADLSSLEQLVNRTQRGELGAGVYTCPRHGQRLLAYAPVAVGPLRWSVGIAMGHGEIAGMINRHALATSGLTAFVVLVFTVLGFGLLRAASKRENLAREAEFLRERAKAAAALTESEERYRTVVESANDAILLAHDGVCLFANQGALRLLGIASPEQLVGRLVTDFVHPSDRERVARIHEQVEARRDAPQSYECRAIAAGALRFDASVAPIPLHQQPCVLVSWRDATARTLAEEHARNEQRLRSLGYLAAGIAHDFNNALTIVYGHLTLALAPGKQNIEDNLHAALAGALRSKELASRLLSFAEGDEIHRRTIAVEVPLRAAIARAIDRTNIRCDLRVQGTTTAVRGDPDRLMLAFEAVLTNAQEAMPDGGVIAISVDHVEVTAEAPNDLEAGTYVRVSVADRGVGIGPDGVGRSGWRRGHQEPLGDGSSGSRAGRKRLLVRSGAGSFSRARVRRRPEKTLRHKRVARSGRRCVIRHRAPGDSMMCRRFILTSSLLALVGCGDGDESSLAISDGTLSGVVGGESWTLVYAETDAFLSDGEDEFFTTLHAQAGTACTYNSSLGNRVLLSVPKTAGDYDLGFMLNGTFAVMTPSGTDNLVATRGRVVVESVGATELRAGVHMIYDDDNEVDGWFTGSVCAN